MISYLKSIQILNIDELGRIALPLSLRQKLGINRSSRLSLEVKNDEIIIRQIVKEEADLIYENDLLVIKTDPLESSIFSTIVDDIREEKVNEFI